MNLSFYTAAVGAQQQQRRMNIQGNNIANVNTYGYKAEQSIFTKLMYGAIRGIEDEELPRGSGTHIVSTKTDSNNGGLYGTKRVLDYAIEGDGFFGLYDPLNGEISFTRDGSFTMSEYYTGQGTGEGDEMEPERVWRLADGHGRFVLDSQGGFINLTSPNDEPDVGVFDFTITDGMRRTEDNRYIPVDKNGPMRLGNGKVVQGYLVLSNVDLGNEIAKVIEAQRSYSYALRMVQTSDEIESTINGLRG